MTKNLSVCILVGLLSAAAAVTQPRLETLFEWRAELRFDDTQAGELFELELPAEVLAECSGDLADLRLIDSSGAQIPYALDRGLPPEIEASWLVRVEAKVKNVDRSRSGAAARLDLWRERYVLELPTVDSPSGSWDLVLHSDQTDFVRQASVERLETELADNGEAIWRGSLFRLGGGVASLRVPLPAASTTGTGFLAVELEGQGGGYLEPRFSFLGTVLFASRSRELVPLEVTGQSSENGVTTVELRRPPGLVPEVIEITTSTPAFARPVELVETESSGGERRLGGATLYRLAAAVSGATSLLDGRLLPVSPVQSGDLRLRVVDGDAPPLAELSVRAGLRLPRLLFSTSSRDVDLFFGGGRVDPPRYDLAALLGRLPLDSGLRLATATPASPLANPAFDAAPILAFAHRPGALLDSRPWSHQRQLTVPATTEGLASLTLGAEDLAILAADLSDLRLVDSESRQWAYLTETLRPPTSLAVALSSRSADGETVVDVDLPAAPLPVVGLVLETDVPYFDRPFELSGQRVDSKEWVRLTGGRLEREAGSSAALTLSHPESRLLALRLEIQDGDDAPLTFSSGEVRLTERRVFFPSPEGQLQLLLGNPRARKPDYELERIRDVVLAVSSEPAEAGPLEENPAFARFSTWRSGSALQEGLLWLAIGLAVIVLAFVTFRLVHSPVTSARK